MNAAILLIVMALCGLLMLASIIYLVWGLIQALLWKMDTWRFRRKLELERQRPKVAADSPRDVRLNEFVHELDEAVGYSLNGMRLKVGPEVSCPEERKFREVV